MRFEFPGDELEWIDQQIAGAQASIERLRTEIAAYDDQLARLYATREAIGLTIGLKRPAGAIVIPSGAMQSRSSGLS